MALSDSKPLVALVLLGLLVIGVYRFRSKSAVEVNLPNVDDQSLFVDVAGVETPVASEEQQQPAAPTVPPPTFKPLELIRPPEMLKTNLDLQSPDMRAACSLPYFSLVGKEASFSPDAHRLIASHVIVTPGVTAPRDFPPHELSQQLLAGLDCSFNVSTWSKLLYPPLKELLQFLAAQRAPNSSIEQHIRNTLNAQECKFGQITPTGLVQNMLVGKYLAHLFVEKSGLLTQNESAKVFIRAVNEQPTFVAAIATAFGFFLRGKLDLKYLKVRPVNDSFLCAERWNMTCACGPADDMREDVWAGVDRGFQQFNPPDAFRADYARWAIMLDKLNVQPHEFFPQFHNAMAHHCAQVDFPCLAHGAAEAKNESETKRCLPFTPVDYRVGFDAYQFLNKDLNNNRFLLASDTLKVYPYLLELIARLDTAEQRRRNNSDDYLKVSLTFAQPEFVTALKRALGVNVDGRMTGFASRFSFELYETIKRNPGEVLIRIVENGQPLTMAATKVCDKTYQTMCQLQRFRESLVTRLMLENVGISDYKRACKRAPARPKKTIEHDSL